MNLVIHLTHGEEQTAPNAEESLVDPRSVGITEDQAADLRNRFATFAEDWDSAEMEIYDRYDSAMNQLRSKEVANGSPG